MRAGWVARLPSGSPHLDRGAGSETRRLDARTEAVTNFLMQQDTALLSERLSGTTALLCRDGYSPVLHHELRESALQRLPQIWSAIERAISRNSRRATARAIHRAESILLSHFNLPFLLDNVPSAMYAVEMASLFDWLQSDAGAKAVRRKLSSVGTWHNLFTAVLSAKLERFDQLSRALLFAADRAAVVFAAAGNAAEVGKDEMHRLAWQAIDTLAANCGENLWLCCDRPAFLDEPIDRR